ncbi:MAG: phosphatase PAP2 family protein [bacterium]|nr:phosphatase PAP2 family protein [bacterium]
MNTSFFNFINGLSGKWWPLDWLGIFLANYSGYFLAVTAIILLIKIKDQRQRIYFFSLAILSVILARGIITEIIRFFYYQPRPFLVLEIQPLIAHTSTGSFPSGHAAAFFALALAVFYFNRKWGWWILTLSLFMGLARIFVGVHWPLDILVGAGIGLISAFLIKKLLPK